MPANSLWNSGPAPANEYVCLALQGLQGKRLQTYFDMLRCSRILGSTPASSFGKFELLENSRVSACELVWDLLFRVTCPHGPPRKTPLHCSCYRKHNKILTHLFGSVPITWVCVAESNFSSFHKAKLSNETCLWGLKS